MVTTLTFLLLVSFVLFGSFSIHRLRLLREREQEAKELREKENAFINGLKSGILEKEGSEFTDALTRLNWQFLHHLCKKFGGLAHVFELAGLNKTEASKQARTWLNVVTAMQLYPIDSMVEATVRCGFDLE